MCVCVFACVRIQDMVRDGHSKLCETVLVKDEVAIKIESDCKDERLTLNVTATLVTLNKRRKDEEDQKQSSRGRGDMMQDMIEERIGGRRKEERRDLKYEEGTHSINPPTVTDCLPHAKKLFQ